MDKIPQVLHRSARAVTTAEFYDAIMATCPPRFPGVRGTSVQKVVLAISGGVDSMALAYLCQRVRKKYIGMRVSDNPLGSFYGVVVDHGLREGSANEARKVVSALQEHVGLKAEVATISWKDDNGNPINPHDLPNFETVARQKRYNRIASMCSPTKAVSVFTAHNEDDQYETVLMRLLSGHGYRGLQGMRAATDIPECYERHGVYQSGYVDDQMRAAPVYNTRPTVREIKSMKRELRSRIDPSNFAWEWLRGSKADPTSLYQREYDGIATGSRQAPKLAPMDIEDGGIMLYRPLLNFSKDRLIATCLENKIPWFEDKTNHDPSFTMRNAVRHMCKNYTLPVALQKPAILEFSRRCRDKVAAQKAETDRLFKRTTIHDFEPNVGTAVVELPKFSFPRSPRLSLTSFHRRQKRIAHYRIIAALLIQRLLSLVTPERELTPIKNLDYLVTLLFPNLAISETEVSYPPKPYVICGVHFTPLIGNYSPRWLISRAPYPSNVPRPRNSQSPLRYEHRYGRNQDKWPWRGWPPWKLYDGRYWIRMRHRLPALVEMAPFEPEHHKPFREALADNEARTVLALMLKRYAPGKVRYTLPAIYAKGKVDDLLKGGDYWSRYSHLWIKGLGKKGGKEGSEDSSEKGQQNNGEGKTTADEEARESSDKTEIEGMKPWQMIPLLEKQDMDTAKPVLLALPTLGIYLPGVEDWVEWDIRFRKVDLGMVTQSRRFWVGSDSGGGWMYKGGSGGGGGGIEHRSGWTRPSRRTFAVWRGFKGVERKKRSARTYRVSSERLKVRRMVESRSGSGSGSMGSSMLGSSSSSKLRQAILMGKYFSVAL
ncbi:hypothetical protein V8F20_004995 [Naviculisporaceae sp. PSN 640]